MIRFIVILAICFFSPILAAADEPVLFGRDILPILSDNCFHCHGPDEKNRAAGLRLDQEAAAKLVTDGAAAIVPGSSSKSELIRRLRSNDPEERMPPPTSNRRVNDAQIKLLERWINDGARWGQHWAYEPPQRPSLPPVKQTAWLRNPIDHFILARLERESLAPSPEASPTVLVRRLYLDLLGLPPQPDEVAAFVHDASPDAYERLVDRLLASPRYGERWAWDWLDAARYADSNGYQGDPERTMWPWRDWVVRAINQNQSYDQFTIEQLAGDLLPEATLPQRLATGFNRNHMFNGEGGRIAEETRVENVMDRAETTATVWLGITLGCARCHDHKFDPFTNREYYQFYAYFNNTSETGGASGGGRSGQITPIIEVASDADLARLNAARGIVTALNKEVEAFEREIFARPEGKPASESPAAANQVARVKTNLARAPQQRDRDALVELATAFKAARPEYERKIMELHAALIRSEKVEREVARVMVMDEQAKPRETFILVKGLYSAPTTTKVDPGTPTVFPALKSNASDSPQVSNRRALAEWLMMPEHPLTARVTVNRYWQAFFGVGLVKTAEDFGVQGERPSHPELLDWLATEFVRQGWDVKALHRAIVTSATYRQQSSVTPALWERDPENRLVARGPRFRLPSWLIRDQALTAAGLLSPQFGGPSVKPYQPPGIWEEATFGKKSYVQDHGESLYRRSLYIFWRRIVGPTMFFDNSARQVCTIKPSRTNTPLQALVTLNDTTYVEAARLLAQAALQSSSNDAERVQMILRRALGRNATSTELQILTETLQRLRNDFSRDIPAAEQLIAIGEMPRDPQLPPTELAAFTALSSLVMNLDEFLTKQ